MAVYFGDKIKEARTRAGMTQRQLAKLVGVKNTSISNWENNLSRPDPDTIQLLCGALGISPSYLFGVAPDDNQPGTKKAPGPDSSEPRDENEREIISYLRRLLPQQQVFLLALLKTVDGLNQQTQSADPVSDGDRVPVPEFPSQT